MLRPVLAEGAQRALTQPAPGPDDSAGMKRPNRIDRKILSHERMTAMGIDLNLLPIDSLHGTQGYSHTILRTERARATWPKLTKLARPLPEHHDISALTVGRVPDGYAKGAPMYGRADADAYGEPYTWLEAGVVADVLTEDGNFAPTIAYLRALPADTMVILDWR